MSVQPTPLTFTRFRYDYRDPNFIAATPAVSESNDQNLAVTNIAQRTIRPFSRPNRDPLQNDWKCNKSVVLDAIKFIKSNMTRPDRLNDCGKLYTEALRYFHRYRSFDYSRLFGAYLCALLIDARRVEDPRILQTRLEEAKKVIYKAGSHRCGGHCCMDLYLDRLFKQIWERVIHVTSN